jgi:hypothetical protein
METGMVSFGCPTETSPSDILGQFVEVFASKGWLNRNLRIRRQNLKYRIFCSEAEFMVFRINDNCGVSPGIPGWPVCVVNRERIVEDEHLSGFASTEPSAYEWLTSFSTGNFELI